MVVVALLEIDGDEWKKRMKSWLKRERVRKMPFEKDSKGQLGPTAHNSHLSCDFFRPSRSSSCAVVFACFLWPVMTLSNYVEMTSLRRMRTV